ncbi:hypothetical protein GCM10027596_32090 [Nocardioides korecus]
MSPDRRTAPPPTGLNPPTTAPGPDGTTLDLVLLAEQVCTLYYTEYADEDERYGEAGRAWCRHDNQHLLSWAAESVEGFVDLHREVTWLAGVLEAREFPVDRLARNLELGAEVVRLRVPQGEDLAGALVGAARMVRERGTFL